jgi:adenosylcobinamide-GDP ribazoletransferase
MSDRADLSVTEQIALCLGFFTRLPVRLRPDLPADAMLRSVWAFPVAGAAIGALAALFAVTVRYLGLSPTCVAIATLGLTSLLTGALHEDGLADTADGLGGGRDAAAKLAIMRDSRIGSYGVLALLVSFALKAACLAQIAGRGDGALCAGLVAAHAAARGGLPALMAALPLARETGAAAAVGRPAAGDAGKAAVLGGLILLVSLGFSRGLLAILLAGLAVWILGRLAFRQIGGYTGDVLGAAEQAVEVMVLLAAATV